MNATTRLADRVKLKDAHLITRMTDIAEGLSDVIKLGRGDPDLDTPAHIIKAGQDALGNGATHYTHPLGLPALRQAIAANIAAYGGATYAPDNIVVTPGGQHAMFIIALALLNPGDEILVPCPGYNPYHQAAEMAGAETVHIRMTMETNFTLTAEMVEAHITPRSKILVLINPSNPTGTVTPPSEVRRIAEVAKKHDLIVISDEIYARLTYGNNTVQPVASLPGMFERTITLSGLSKAYAMTGWRIGYFAGPPDLIPALAEINHAFAISTAAASQHAAIAALTGPQDCVEEMRQIYDARRIALCAGLSEMGIPYAEPQGAFYVYANVASTGIGATAFCERLLREGQVLMYPGGIYGDYTDDFVRMSLTQPVDRIREAITRMKTVVAAIRAESRLKEIPMKTDNPNVIGIKHMAFGVRDAEAALATYARFLDVPADTEITVFPKSKNKVALFNLGGIEYQLCQSLDPQGRFATWIDERGSEGLHHICYEVTDIDMALAHAQEKGAKLRICQACQKYGSHPHPEGWVAFLDNDAGGIEIEFMQVYTPEQLQQYQVKGV